MGVVLCERPHMENALSSIGPLRLLNIFVLNYFLGLFIYYIVVGPRTTFLKECVVKYLAEIFRSNETVLSEEA